MARKWAVRRSGSPEVWIAGSDGSGTVRMTNLRGDVGRPSWSSDGTRMAFAMQRFGVSKIYAMRCPPGKLQCEPPEPLVDGANPTWSLDGKFVYFNRPDRGLIWKLPLSGGPAVSITPGIEALASHDRKWLYFTRNVPVNGRFFRAPLNEDG